MKRALLRSWAGHVVVAAVAVGVVLAAPLAAGGDGFTVFKQGTNDLGGAQDIDALVNAFTAAEPGGVAVPALNRIVPIAA